MVNAALDQGLAEKFAETLMKTSASNFADLKKYNELASTVDAYDQLVAGYMKTFKVGDSMPFTNASIAATTPAATLAFDSVDNVSSVCAVTATGGSATGHIADEAAILDAMYVASVLELVKKFRDDDDGTFTAVSNNLTADQSLISIAAMTAFEGDNWHNRIVDREVLPLRSGLEFADKDDNELTFNPLATGLLVDDTLTITTSPTGMTAATYTAVPLTGVSTSGTGATATIVVGSGTAITSVTVDGQGSGYAAANTLTVAAGLLGSSSAAGALFTLVAGDLAPSGWQKSDNRAGIPFALKVIANNSAAAQKIDKPLLDATNIAALFVNSTDAVKDMQGFKFDTSPNSGDNLVLAGHLASGTATAAIGSMTGANLKKARALFKTDVTAKQLLAFTTPPSNQAIVDSDPAGAVEHIVSLGHDNTNFTAWRDAVSSLHKEVDGYATLGKFRAQSSTDAGKYLGYLAALKEYGATLPTQSEMDLMFTTAASAYQKQGADGAWVNATATDTIKSYALKAMNDYDINAKLTAQFSNAPAIIAYLRGGDSDLEITSTQFTAFLTAVDTPARKQALAAYIIAYPDGGKLRDVAIASHDQRPSRTADEQFQTVISYVGGDQDLTILGVDATNFARQARTRIAEIANDINGVDVLTNKGFMQVVKNNGDFGSFTDMSVAGGKGYGGNNGFSMSAKALMSAKNTFVVNAEDSQGNNRTDGQKLDVLKKIMENFREVFQPSRERLMEVVNASFKAMDGSGTHSAEDTHILGEILTSQADREEYVRKYCGSAAAAGVLDLPVGFAALHAIVVADTAVDKAEALTAATNMFFGMPNLTVATRRRAVGAITSTNSLTEDQFNVIVKQLHDNAGWGHATLVGNLNHVIMVLNFGYDAGLLGKLDQVDISSDPSMWNKAIHGLVDHASESSATSARPNNNNPSTPAPFSNSTMFQVSEGFTSYNKNLAAKLAPAFANPSTDHYSVMSAATVATNIFNLSNVLIEYVLGQGSDDILGDAEQNILKAMGVSASHLKSYRRAFSAMMSDGYTQSPTPTIRSVVKQ
jgi:hypothetical protein